MMMHRSSRHRRRRRHQRLRRGADDAPGEVHAADEERSAAEEGGAGEVLEGCTNCLVGAPRHGSRRHSQQNPRPHALEEAAHAALADHRPCDAEDPSGSAAGAAAGLGLHPGLDHIERGRCSTGNCATDARAEKVPRCICQFCLSAASAADLQEALQGVVAGDEHAVVGDVHGQGDRQAAVEAPKTLLAPDRQGAIHRPAVPAQLEPLLGDVVRRQDGVVDRRGRGAAGRHAHWLMRPTLGRELCGRQLVGAEEACVRGHAARADHEGAAHQAEHALVPEHGTHSLADAEPHRGCLHVGLHRVQRVHAHMLHDPGAAPSDRVLPEGRAAVAHLPLEWVLVVVVVAKVLPLGVAGIAPCCDSSSGSSSGPASGSF
mmetsp:Transcript_39493/g.104207  ORF Transcript_39493/g.104207 Transcript_39493/m.104207 type:complete len:374 (-) Transcript_39493:157-1278(-)